MLKRRIFLRTATLLLALIGSIATALMLFTVREHRTATKRLHHTGASALAGEIERLILWDDRVAIRQAVDREMEAHHLLEYIFVVRNGQVYMDTFNGDVSAGLLHPTTTNLEKSFIWEFLDTDGAVYYDMVVPVGKTGAVLRIGMKRHNIDKQTYPAVLIIALVSFIAFLVGLILSYRIALRATRETMLLSGAIHSYSDKGDETRLKAVGNVADVTELAVSFRALVSDRKQAEEALRESEEEYRSIFENAVEGFFQSTPKGRFISVNPSFAKMLGYASPEELISNISDIVKQYYANTEDRLRYKQLLEKDGSVGHFEFKARCKDGSQIWVSNSTRAIYDRDGKIARYEGNVNNITLRKQAEEALLESEEKYRSMMEAMKDPVYICSPDFQVEYMNPAMIRRTGLDATGEYCFKALHNLNEKCPWCVHNKVQQGEHLEFNVVSPKDNRSYHVSHSPIVHEDGSISKMTVYRDTTDSKKMETQLQQAQKMEAIGSLAGGIAHDFNNILFPISGYTEMLLLDTPGDSPFHHGLSEILAGAKRAGELVNQILTFSRQREHELKPLKVELVVKEVLKLIRSSLPTTIEIRQNINKDLGLVMADSTQIHQIVMNLTTNAYHAMEETGGNLNVTLKKVELGAGELMDSTMDPGSYVCLTVADTGMGMDQSVVDRMFDPYFTTKEEGKGTGLGLSVVHGIVKSHGGHISVYSEPGKGTEMNVYLPLIQTQAETAEGKTPLPIEKGNESVLLVDDREEIVSLAKDMLYNLGYHVTARTSSIEALEAFRANPHNFDLVITDLTMPNMTGDKLAQQLMAIRPDIPVILCTGFSEKMSEEKAEALGIKGFLMKPIIMSDLAKTIREVLEYSKIPV